MIKVKKINFILDFMINTMINGGEEVMMNEFWGFLCIYVFYYYNKNRE